MANLSFVKLLEIPLSPLEVQRVIVDKIVVERKVIRRLLQVYQNLRGENQTGY